MHHKQLGTQSARSGNRYSMKLHGLRSARNALDLESGTNAARNAYSSGLHFMREVYISPISPIPRLSAARKLGCVAHRVSSL